MFTSFAPQPTHISPSQAHGSRVSRPLGALLGVMLGLATAMSPAAAAAQAPRWSQEPSPDGISLDVTPIADRVAAAPTAPQALIKNLAAMDEAANQQQLARLVRFYRADFSHSDGLNRSTLKQAVKTFWQQYQQLNYTTKLVEWQAEADGDYVATTTTTITGRRPLNRQSMQLSATITSRQRWTQGKLVSQTILSEQSQLSSGSAAPQVTVYLPDQVKVGETYNFDVIVDEPLGDRVLVGTALAEGVSADGYVQQPSLELEPLPTGGLFKVGQAPDQPGHEWISAVLVQEDGMIMIHRRLIVIDQ